MMSAKMREALAEAAMRCALIAGVAAVGVDMQACISAREAGADGAYAAKQLACVDMASTSALATACRNCVKAAIAAGEDSDRCFDGLR